MTSLILIYLHDIYIYQAGSMSCSLFISCSSYCYYKVGDLHHKKAGPTTSTIPFEVNITAIPRSSVPNITKTTAIYIQTLSIAAVGGGIDGLNLALGPLRDTHMDVHVSEFASSFGETSNI